MQPDPDGIEPASAYASPGFFADTLVELLSLRIAAAAEQAGVGDYSGCVERLELWNENPAGADLFAASQ